MGLGWIRARNDDERESAAPVDSMQGVMPVQPITDLALWLRFLSGSAVVLWLPGYLLAGRHMRFRPAPTRHVISASIGLVLLPLWAQFMSPFGLGVRPLQYLPAVLIATAAIGTTEIARRLAGAIDAEEPSAPWEGATLVAAVALGMGAIVAGFGEFVVPPTTHDAANHAFMTLRVTETGTVLASEVFGAPHGAPSLPYAMGQHAIASMLAQVSGLAPYLSVWFLALSTVALLPICLSIAWSEWRLPAATIALAVLFAAANPYVPSRLLWWGLFGNAIGLFLVPISALLLDRFWSNATVESGIAAGAACGSLMLIHGSELPTAGLIALTTILLHRRPPEWNAAGWATFIGTGGVCGWHFLTAVLPSYLSGGIKQGDGFIETLAMTGEHTVSVFGTWPSLQAVGLFAVGLGLYEKRMRIPTLFTLAIVLVVTTLALWRDPISELLTTPYYRQPERVRYQLIFFVPLLIGFALHWIWIQVKAETWPRMSRVIVALGVVSALLLPELPQIAKGYETKKTLAPFGPADFEHAQKIADYVQPGEWVLNQFFDGSSWAMHISGRPFLVPTGWLLRDLRGRPNKKILQRVLRGMPLKGLDGLDKRFRYLYVSDLRTGRPHGFTRARADKHPSFEEVLVGKHSTLYRILRPDER